MEIVGGLTDFHYKVTSKVLRTGQLLVFDRPAHQVAGISYNTMLEFLRKWTVISRSDVDVENGLVVSI